MTTAAMVTYAYDQIDQARTELERPEMNPSGAEALGEGSGGAKVCPSAASILTACQRF